MTIIRKRNIHRGNFPRKQEFIQGVQDCLEKARQLYPEFTLKLLPIVFYPKGSAAGRAKWKRVGSQVVYNVEFSVEAIGVDWENMYLDTIPHEIGHIVARFIYGHKAQAHGPEWKRISRSLGCTGERCHEMNLTKAHSSRRQRELYISDSGDKCVVGPTQHKKIQNKVYDWFRIKATGEQLYARNHVGPA